MRPSKFKEEYTEQLKVLCRLGATDKDLAEFFKVTEQTINNWKKAKPEFFEALKNAKDEADEKVEKSLFQRATGYQHEEDKIFNANGEPLIVPTVKRYPPDTVAAIFWLKNRKPEQWREKQEIDYTDKTIPDISALTDEEKKALAEINRKLRSQ